MRLYPVPRHGHRDLSCPPQDTKQKNLTDELLTAQGTNCIYAHIGIAPCTYSVDGTLTGLSVLLPDCPRSLTETISGTRSALQLSQTFGPYDPKAPHQCLLYLLRHLQLKHQRPPPPLHPRIILLVPKEGLTPSPGTTGSYSSPSGAELSGSSVKKPPSPASAVGIALGIFTFLLLCLCLGFWLRRRVLRKRRAAAVAQLGEIADFPDGLVAPSPSTTRFARNESVAATANANVAAWSQCVSSAVHSTYSAESEKDSEGSRTKERELQFQPWSVQEPFPAYPFSRGLSAKLSKPLKSEPPMSPCAQNSTSWPGKQRFRDILAGFVLDPSDP
ncbi:hypothetical protein B0H13DRAFT_1899314 [Mycena leptocephala]|nr:hypothetical protein B0H13DRAFT_1899314 [Mycena leptocephala]